MKLFASAVRGSFLKFTGFVPYHIPFNKNIFIRTNISESRSIMGWEDEKAKYLQMPIIDKRKEYRTKEHYDISDIKTWAEYYKESKAASKLPPAIPLANDVTINETQNEALAKKISMFVGDITSLEVDAIVNAANSTLLGGGGVDGAIHRAAGPLLYAECQSLRGCSTGSCKLSGGYKLPAKYVIHSVGPRGEKPDLLRSCYSNAIDIILDQKLRTIAFPCISTGIYGYPIIPAAHVAAHEIRRQLEVNPVDIDRVIFCLFLEEDVKIYQSILQSYFPVS